MVVSDLVFDAVVFGALLLALLLDNAFGFSPALHGAALLLAIGAAAYFAAQEMCSAMQRRGWWTQEPLATTVALSTAGFLYYFARNDSDLALLGLSIGLMMAALMTMISLLAAFSAAWLERGVRPLFGLAATLAGALGLGALSGLLIFALSSNAPLPLKAVVLAIGAVLWKLREKLRPPARNQPASATDAASVTDNAAPDAPLAAPVNAVSGAPAGMAAAVTAADALSGHPAPASGIWGLMPQRGTLLDRFLPVLLLGALFFLAFRENGPATLLPSGPPAAASNQTRQPDGAAGDAPAVAPRDAPPDAPHDRLP